ncbi:hypothetical protein GCM10028801_31110 [Nocardioides maradonensis]
MSTTTNTQTLDLDSMSLEELQALVEARKNAFLADLGVLAQDTVASIVEARKVKESETSAWVGASVSQIPVTYDGRQYSVSVRITDTAATKAREPQFPKKPATKAETKSE